MMLFSLGFPLFFIMMGIGFTVGALAVAVVLGTVSLILVLGLIYLGVIRITPLIDLAGRAVEWWFPGVSEKIAANIKKSLTVGGKGIEQQGIYVFHPHGMFSTSHFFHIGTELTEWPRRGVRPCAISWGLWVPFGKEIYEKFRCVGSEYGAMKEVLEGGESLAVTIGGIREILHIRRGAMEVCIARKRGIFRMAIETRVPLVPVLCYGENEQFQLAKIWGLDWIQKALMKFGLCIPVPSLDSWKRWGKLFSGKLETPIHCVIGEPVNVEEQDTLERLRERYIEALKKLYADTRPSWYASELTIV